MSTDSARLQPPVVDPPELRITGPQLKANIKAFAPFWDRLQQINDLCVYADLGLPTGEGDPTWAELYENFVQQLADDIEARWKSGAVSGER